jgi:hypothetical protein
MNFALDTEKINDDFLTVSFITISCDVSIVYSGHLVMLFVVKNSGL